ncbi:MAG: 2-hydroxychromene-2-carboxylate isomerase [Thermoleophilia bacterium]
MQPVLYYDLGSPYAYLAAERASEVLGREPRFEPVLVGGIFAERGYGSWAHTREREQRIAEIEARAANYGLPPVIWPAGWPNDTLKAMRAAVWADRLGLGVSFAQAAFRRAFRDGVDLSQTEELADVATSLGLPGEQLEESIGLPEIKSSLREATERAFSQGVAGVPCVEVFGEIFFGDDRLEEAAEKLHRKPSS